MARINPSDSGTDRAVSTDEERREPEDSIAEQDSTSESDPMTDMGRTNAPDAGGRSGSNPDYSPDPNPIDIPDEVSEEPTSSDGGGDSSGSTDSSPSGSGSNGGTSGGSGRSGSTPDYSSDPNPIDIPEEVQESDTTGTETSTSPRRATGGRSGSRTDFSSDPSPVDAPAEVQEAQERQAEEMQEFRGEVETATRQLDDSRVGLSSRDFFPEQYESVERAVEEQNPGAEAGEDFQVSLSESGEFQVEARQSQRRQQLERQREAGQEDINRGRVGDPREIREEDAATALSDRYGFEVTEDDVGVVRDDGDLQVRVDERVVRAGQAAQSARQTSGDVPGRVDVSRTEGGEFAVVAEDSTRGGEQAASELESQLNQSSGERTVTIEEPSRATMSRQSRGGLSAGERRGPVESAVSLSTDLTRDVRENIVRPAAESAGDAVNIGTDVVGAQTDFLAGREAEIDPDDTSLAGQATEQVVLGAGESAAALTVGLPAIADRGYTVAEGGAEYTASELAEGDVVDPVVAGGEFAYNVAAEEVQFATSQPARYTGQVAGGAFVGGAAGRTAARVAPDRLTGGRLSAATRVVADPVRTSVRAGRRRVSGFRDGGDSLSTAASSAADSRSSELGSGGYGQLLDADAVDQARGVTGPSMRSRVRGRLERTGVPDRIRSFQDDVRRFMEDTRGQQQLAFDPELSESGTTSTPDAPRDYSPSRSEILEGSPRDRISQDVAERSIADVQRVADDVGQPDDAVQAFTDADADATPVFPREQSITPDVDAASGDVPAAGLDGALGRPDVTATQVGAARGAAAGAASEPISLLDEAQQPQVGTVDATFGLIEPTSRLDAASDATTAGLTEDFVDPATDSLTAQDAVDDTLGATGTTTTPDVDSLGRGDVDQQLTESIGISPDTDSVAGIDTGTDTRLDTTPDVGVDTGVDVTPDVGVSPDPTPVPDPVVGGGLQPDPQPDPTPTPRLTPDPTPRPDGDNNEDEDFLLFGDDSSVGSGRQFTRELADPLGFGSDDTGQSRNGGDGIFGGFL